MRTDNLFPSKYVKPADLVDGPQIVAMRELTVEEIGQGKEKGDKPVLYFENRKKGLILNLTNLRTIEDGYGRESDDWAGREVELFATKVDFKGDRVDGVRVRIPKSPSANELVDAQAPLAPRPTRVEQPAGNAPAELDDKIPFAPVRDLP